MNTIEVKINKDVAVVDCSGYHLTSRAVVTNLRGTFRRLVKKQNTKIVIVLNGTNINQDAADLLIGSWQILKKSGGGLKFAGLSEANRSLLEYKEIGGKIERFSTPEEAVESFR